MVFYLCFLSILCIIFNSNLLEKYGCVPFKL